MGILNDIGLLQQNGELSEDAATSFVQSSVQVLKAGSGVGAGPLQIDIPITFTKVPGTDNSPFSNVDNYQQHKQQFSTFHSIHIDGIYKTVAMALNINAGKPLLPPPFIDPTFALPNLGIDLPALPTPFTLPDLQLWLTYSLNIQLLLPQLDIDPDLALTLPTVELPNFILGLALPTPFPPSIPIPTLTPPDIGLPNWPYQIPPDLNFSIPGFPLPIFNIILKIATCVIGILLTLVGVSELTGLVNDIAGGDLEGVLTTIIGLMLTSDCLGIDLTQYAVLASAMVVHIKNIACILLVVLVGLAIGSGEIVRGLAKLLGLI